MRRNKYLYHPFANSPPKKYKAIVKRKIKRYIVHNPSWLSQYEKGDIVAVKEWIKSETYINTPRHYIDNKRVLYEDECKPLLDRSGLLTLI